MNDESITSRISRLTFRERQEVRHRVAMKRKEISHRVQFSIFFFGDSASTQGDRYQLLIECAKLADDIGFEAIWTPERHFNPFGGPYPNPSVLASALAMVTRRIKLRAGSIVLPLHHPHRVAEEWSVVDNLSGGRVGVSFASGWNLDDFILSSEPFDARKRVMFERIEVVQRLWEGEAVRWPNTAKPLAIHPRPVQRSLPTWITASTDRNTWASAGKIGAGVLTGMMQQNVDGLIENIEVYRTALNTHNHPAERHRVTLMLHTYISLDESNVVPIIREPLSAYLRAHLDFYEASARRMAPEIRSEQVTARDRETLVEMGLRRYCETSGLFGSPEAVVNRVREFQSAGVTEIACLVDFGLPSGIILKGLHGIAALSKLCNEYQGERPSGSNSATSANAAMFAENESSALEWASISAQFETASCHIRVRDGTRLAAFFYRSTGSGKLPVLWMHDCYHMIRTLSGKQPLVRSNNEDPWPWLSALIQEGYIVVVVDARGTGASFGSWDGPFGRVEIADLYDVTEWLAVQEWSTGNIGMIGRSYSGIAQFFAASTNPPHLRGVFAEMPMGDLYGFLYHGGIFREDFAKKWSERVRSVDLSDGIPVNGDNDGVLLQEAVAEHSGNRDVYEMFCILPFRDSIDSGNHECPYVDRDPFNRISAIRESQIPICILSGWMDVWTRDAILWFRQLSNAKRLIIGPWSHGGGRDAKLAKLQAEWFDPILKRRGEVPTETRVRTFTIGRSYDEGWRETVDWPPPNSQVQRLYFASGRSGTVDSCNDGILSKSAPESNDGADAYSISNATTTGTTSRWANAYGGDFGYPDMSNNDRQCLTYTTELLIDPLEITGHPIVRIWVSSDALDCDVFVLLEQIYKGCSEYVTEGSLRASHRFAESHPLKNAGIPWHPSNSCNLQSGLTEPTELQFDLAPISVLVPRNARLRISICGCDAGNTSPAAFFQSPLMVHRSFSHPSSILIPVVSE